ncbi:hypothetical protein BDW59DRAFT_138894 [Aspergillus cavernicola]|uniref:Protein kinase domain-containing protein n=1 Tax=Aspergillus cavernicola TaxID=176166 RepID=A0ABR4J1K0_9EURO
MAISIADSSCSSPRSSLGFLLDPEKLDPPRPKQSMWHRLGLRRWLGRDDRDFSSSRSPASSETSPASNDRSKRSNSPPPKSHDNLTRRLSRRVGVGLPRSANFKRQHSERRDRLSPVATEPRRAVSADRRELSLQRTKSPQSVVDPRLSAPEVHWREDPDPGQPKVDEDPETNEEITQDEDVRSEWDHYPEVTDAPEEYPVDFLDMELEKRWILNLSMHFRDRSEREKFFVTYAEAPNRWRRVTISCDYRDTEPDSLEHDLKELRYQRDKCARIYDSIRESLPDIQFYDTVTNLKLETRDGRLHVHVTEDVNEIIPYPPISSIGHLPGARLVPERHLHFEAHLSGFVYNVRLNGRHFIKKEIPGPDTVDEFLYEINALHALQGTPNVIQVEGVVVDDQQEVVKGLLISFAEKGALVDILYEYRGTIAWERRERWARQIVHGLCEIHESGYVQGDFTLSNIVVDANDDAKIIDINRRGCPVGWEPPEIADKIESNQRISMYIGVKTDLYQLGMTLWALAMEEDEPERQRRPFVLDDDMPVPDYYRRMVSICLSPIPRHRLSAKELLNFFPRGTGAFDLPPRMHPPASIGVGLHNGALPLYDSRTAFMYPGGRQMGNFGHSNTQVPQQLPDGDSFESISPEQDGVAYREEQERQLELDDLDEPLPTRPNGIRKGNSMIFDERRPVNDSTPVTVELTPRPVVNQEIQDSTLDYEEREIELDAGINPLYRDTSTDIALSPPSNFTPLPDELAGVGGHPACSWAPLSRNSSVHYQPSEVSVAMHAPAKMYPVDSGAEFCSSQDSSRPVSVLLQSALPINPAAEPLEQEIYTAEDDPSPSTVPLEQPQQSFYPTTYYLSDSNLPINPAVIASEETFDPKVDPLPPLDVQSALDYFHNDIQETSPYLCKSQLPINPAAKLSEERALEVGCQSNVVETIPEYSQLEIQESSNLSDSLLPINPATKSPEGETFVLRTDIALALDVQSTRSSQHMATSETTLTAIEQISTEDNTALAPSERTDTPATAEKSPIEPQLEIPSAQPQPQSEPPTVDIAIQNHNQSSFLCNSQLPINPATISSEDFSEKFNINMNSQSALHRQHSIQIQDPNASLSDSHLPINPATKSSEDTLDFRMDTQPALIPQLTLHPQHSIQIKDLGSLSNSHLPINPAFPDKALQSV